MNYSITGKEVNDRWELRRASTSVPTPEAKPVWLQGVVTCEEASTLSRERYIPCLAPAVALVDNRDRRAYFMCGSCALHNIENRGARLMAYREERE